MYDLSIYKTNQEKTKQLQDLFKYLIKSKTFAQVINDEETHFNELCQLPMDHIKELSTNILNLLLKIPKNHIAYDSLLTVNKKLYTYLKNDENQLTKNSSDKKTDQNDVVIVFTI